MGRISKALAAEFRDVAWSMKGSSDLAGLNLATEKDETVHSADELVRDGYDPIHAAYLSTQNVVSSFAEKVSELDEFDSYYRIVSKAQDEYMPDGPPISPLTLSYFTSWAFFDLPFGRDRETIGTCLLDVADVIGMDPIMVEVLRKYQESRMGIYEHCGFEGGDVWLTELVTNKRLLCHCTSGYLGREGELWFVRICPPFAGLDAHHVTINTPYVLLGASKTDWTAYLNKSTLHSTAGDRPAALHCLLKYGAERTAWHEFIFQAYHHHQYDAIFLTGLPDVAASRPHAPRRRRKSN